MDMTQAIIPNSKQNGLFLLGVVRGGEGGGYPLNISFSDPWQVFKTVITSRISVRSTFHSVVHPGNFIFHFLKGEHLLNTQP
jgi:hypothetical protein